MLKIIIGILIVAIITFGGFIYYQSVQEKLATPPTETQVAVSEQEQTPTPTPEEHMKPEDYTIQVQNGSGIAGQAGSVQELLENNDYVVDSTDNADNYDYTRTVIQAKKDVSKIWISDIKSVLKKKYDVQTRIEELDSDADTDVIVIVGNLDDNGEALGVSTSVTDEATETPKPTEEAAETETPTPIPTESS